MRTILVGIILIASAGAYAQSQKKYEPMNVKVGLWEVTRTLTISGAIPIPADLLAKLTPEQRARMAERMKAMAGDRTNTETYRNCVTRKQLEEGPAFDKEKRDCTMTILTSTSSRAEVELACELQGMQGKGAVKLEALSTDEVKGSSQMVLSGNGNTMNSHATFTAKWVGADCGDTR